MPYPSPLRYPGGKKKLYPYIEKIVFENNIQGGTYIEPFAGGANLALCLLFKELVNKIVINDFDRSIYAFWYSVLFQTSELCKLIIDTPVNMESWNLQKRIQENKFNVDLLQLGFSTFFLNRTNRSGIIRGGVIGGKKQSGKWKMDVRYNKNDLIKRITKIARYSGRISLFQKDAIDFISEIKHRLDEKTLIYFDPPYYNQGSALYSNFYNREDHVKLSQFIQQLDCKWVLTYDQTDEVMALYRDVKTRTLTLPYTAQKKTRGNEMIAYSNKLNAPIGTFSSVNII